MSGAPRGKPVAPTSRPSGATSRPKAVAFCCRGKSYHRGDAEDTEEEDYWFAEMNSTNKRLFALPLTPGKANNIFSAISATLR